MKFQIYNQQYNLPDLIRRAGYKAIGRSDQGELNCIKPLGRDYPRFHLYILETPEIIKFNLHLDQKRPSYGEETMHSGDYESETVKSEVQYIKDRILV